MFYQTFLFLILILSAVDVIFGKCDGKKCGECIEQSVFNNNPCNWCNRDSGCYVLSNSPTNPCKRAENVVEKSHCDDKFSRYDPQLSLKMLLLSAAAYDPSDPQECLANSLPSENFQLQEVVTRICDDKGNKCSVYLAVSNVLKAIVIAFRGSMELDQALQVFLKTLSKPKEKFLKDLDGEVQTYWKGGFDKLWPCLNEDIKRLVSAHPSYQVWVTGHSLGGAMASLASTWLSHYKIVPRKNLISYTFGMPRVGNLRYAYEHDLLVNNSWRVVNYDDAVPHFPNYMPNIINGPYHHGIEAYYMAKAVSPNTKHRECHGKPYNEDLNCSFITKPNVHDFTNHRVYFGIQIGTFWTTRCRVSSSRKKRDTVKMPHERFQYRSSVCSRLRNSGHLGGISTKGFS
ncbi:Lipase [Exaiptasia diaphana]|nr:Lipase [Exaiptasia diaphana]